MNYYLYRHIRDDKDETFYIGIGTKLEDFEKISQIYKRAYSIHNRSSFWKNIVLKTTYKIDIVLESDDIEFIKSKETEYIKLYGRRDLNLGTLVNLTDGGDGFKNSHHSKETKIKMSLARKDKSMSISMGEQERIIDMFLSNRSVTSIEKETHHRIETINRILKANGIEKRRHREKITEDIAKDIKVAISLGLKKSEVLKRYKVSPHIYSDIRKGKTWKHV